MDSVEAADSTLLSHYEGLVRTTSSRYVGKTRHDFDDLCQIFRVKVWKALLAWDPTHPRIKKKIKGGETEQEARDAFVFMCVVNQGKDLVKRRKPEHDPLFIEDFASEESNGQDRFESRYLSADDEEVFEQVVGDRMDLPELTDDERQVLTCMYLRYSQPEIAKRLGMKPKKVSAAVKAIKTKLSHLNPSGEAVLEIMQTA